jgi:serine/threonine-protein kinase
VSRRTACARRTTRRDASTSARRCCLPSPSLERGVGAADALLPRRPRLLTPGRSALVVVTAALLAALGSWTYLAVEGSLRELRAATMKSLLDAQVNALHVWVREEIGDAERVAAEARVRGAVAAVLAAASPPGAMPADYCAGPERRRLEEVLRPLLRDLGDSTFNLVRPDGRLLATRFPEYCGLRLTPARFLPLLASVFRGESRFIRPYRDIERVDSPARLREGQAFGWISTPVRDTGGAVLAALSIALPADGVLGRILAAAHPGETGDVFAFDEQGNLLTRGRFPRERFAFPGMNPQDKGGAALTPYLNSRGRQVVAAWRWLDDLGLGVAIEIDTAEAYAPLRFLRVAFGVVLAALLLAVAAALYSALQLMRLGGGRKAGAYRLERLIGSGGLANVYLARHDLLKRPCAVKLLRPNASEATVARFEREVQIGSALSHPNVVEIYDYGRTADALFYYAMEYVDGVNLGELVAREGPLPVARALPILRQLCAGLAAAHAEGLVHRDVKPENVMLCHKGASEDVVKILDFGLVKSVTRAHTQDLTRDARILGTPLYMAPERLRNPADVDARADIYAVGAVAYFILSGKKLFASEDDLALTSSILNDEPRPLSQAAGQPIPAALEQLVHACLAKRREDRPQRVADLIDAFDGLRIGL